MSAAHLEAQGFKNVRFMDGGIAAWPFEKYVRVPNRLSGNIDGVVLVVVNKSPERSPGLFS